MKTFLAAVLAVPLALYCGAEVRAASIRIDYTALITAIEFYDYVVGIPDFTAGITPGTTEISGSLTYDLNQVGTQITNATGEFGSYVLQNIDVSLPTVSYSLVDNTPGISVRNNVDFGVGVNDQLIFYRSVPVVGVDQRLYASLSLSGADMGVFSSVDLPTSLALADFPDRRFAFDYANIYPSPGDITLSGTITSLTVVPVPEPSAVVLLGMGLAASLVLWRRKAVAGHSGRRDWSSTSRLKRRSVWSLAILCAALLVAPVWCRPGR